jgi:hypothetical protein
MNKDEMLHEYTVLGFSYLLCVVERKSDNKRGTLDFRMLNGDSGYVRDYYNFQEA